MNNFVVMFWNDWEILCSDWMKHIADSEHGISTGYQVFGTQGQAQHGVDIFPTPTSCGVVGQFTCPRIRYNSQLEMSVGFSLYLPFRQFAANSAGVW